MYVQKPLLTKHNWVRIVLLLFAEETKQSFGSRRVGKVH